MRLGMAIMIVWSQIAVLGGLSFMVTDIRTDGKTDTRTERPTYRDARIHLKSKDIVDQTENIKASISHVTNGPIQLLLQPFSILLLEIRGGF